MGQSKASVKYPHIDKANQYIEDVLTGRKPACKYVQLACERQKRDLSLSVKSSFPYRFDPEKSGDVCRFIENLPHIKGSWSGKDIKLEGWQLFIITTVFGWVRKSDGLRDRDVACRWIVEGVGELRRGG